MPHIHVIGGISDRDAPLTPVGETGPEPVQVEDVVEGVVKVVPVPRQHGRKPAARHRTDDLDDAS